MGELRDGSVEKIDEIGARPGALGTQGADLGLETLERSSIIDRIILNHADGFEVRHVQAFLCGIELLEVLFARGVAGEEVGMDVHKDSIRMAVLQGEERSTVYEGTYENDVSKIIRRLKTYSQKGTVITAYEAGCMGYTLQRGLARPV